MDLSLLIYPATTTLLLFLLTFLLATIIRNNSIVDIIWGLGFVVSATTSYLLSPTLPGVLLLVLTTIWGIRLATHIGLRNLGQKEDFRYAQWRRDWGRFHLLRSFFQIYLLQWFLLQLVALPITLTRSASPLTHLSILGLIIWAIGFFFEAIGDYQLAVFKSKKKSKGKLMTTGLWALTRHPNYFGEATLWWGIALIGYAASGSLLVFISPLVIDFLLVKVSGIPMLEAKYKGRKDWEAYARRTSAFLPLSPKK